MGCGASTGVKAEAPYLAQYFAAVGKFGKSEIASATKMLQTGDMFDLEKIGAHQAAAEARASNFKEQTQGLLEKSFDHHDKSGDGVLDPTESQLFFSHLVDLKTGSDIAMANWSGKKTVDAGIKMAEMMTKMMGGKLSSEDKKTIKENASRELQALEDNMNKAVDNYKADKENKDKQAFALLDVSKDGKLQKKEFMAAFDVLEGSKQGGIFDALGLNVAVQMQMQIGGGGGGEDCGMQ